MALQHGIHDAGSCASWEGSGRLLSMAQAHSSTKTVAGAFPQAAFAFVDSLSTSLVTDSLSWHCA